MNYVNYRIQSVDDVEALNDRLMRYFSREDAKVLDAQLKPYKPPKTRKQEKALFGHAYVILENELGASKEDFHDHFCKKFFGQTEILAGKKVIGYRPIRTTTRDEDGLINPVSSKVMAQFFERVQIESASEFGVIIPDPDPDWKKRMAEADD
jgi:hypothetical protein